MLTLLTVWRLPCPARCHRLQGAAVVTPVAREHERQAAATDANSASPRIFFHVLQRPLFVHWTAVSSPAATRRHFFARDRTGAARCAGGPGWRP